MNTLASSSNSAMTRTGSIGATALAEQNHRFRGTGGVSRENRSLGFSPAFRDANTGAVYLSRFANGTVAPMHLLDGLPDALVVSRNASGRVLQAQGSVVAGFVRDRCFYSREEASRAVANEGGRPS
jgi:hypothetical protein